MKPRQSIADMLKDHELYAPKLKLIEKHAIPVLSNIQRKFPTYTLHDWEHSLSVAENMAPQQNLWVH